MNGFNEFLTHSFDVILSPFAGWPLATLLVVSCVSGVLMALVFKYVSNQQALATVLDQGRGNALAIKLFKDDLRGMFFSLGNVVWLMVKRIWYSLSPVIVMILPLFFLLSQLYLRYEHCPLAAKESAVVTVQMTPDQWKQHRELEILPTSDFSVETPALRDEDELTLQWRVSATDTTTCNIVFRSDDIEFSKSLKSTADSGNLATVSESRVSGLFESLWFAGEANLNASSFVKKIDIQYPKRELPILGMAIPWWLTFFAVSILSALFSQPVLKVRF